MVTSENAARFRSLADAMESQINNKLNSAISQQRPTQRRARIAAAMEREGLFLKQVQTALYRLADAHQRKMVPKILQGIKNKAQVLTLLQCTRFTNPETKKHMTVAGITTQRQFDKAKSLLISSLEQEKESTEQLKIKQLERDLIGRKIPGFFVTPRSVVDKMVIMADIRPGMIILEPSAGIGNIAEGIRQQFPSNTIEVIECNTRLVEILELKGFHLVGVDFLESHKKYDRILMNPPFEKGQDIDHVLHAYNCLKRGGRITAIMSEGVFFRKDKKSIAFREWLETVIGSSEKLPTGTFSKEFTATGVVSRIITINR